MAIHHNGRAAQHLRRKPTLTPEFFNGIQVMVTLWSSRLPIAVVDFGKEELSEAVEMEGNGNARPSALEPVDRVGPR